MNPQLQRLLDNQGGVATSGQLLTVLTRRALEAQLNSGALTKLWTGVYGRGEPDMFLRLRGLDLTAGAQVAVCLGTAATLFGFDIENTVDLHVLNPSGHQLRSVDGLVVHRRDGAPLSRVAGRPTTAPAWTAIEVARALRPPRALATLDAALRCGVDRFDMSVAVKAQAGRRGIVAVRELLPLAAGEAASPMESEARLVMISGGLPTPILQYPIVDRSGRTWRVDFAWPEFKVAVEYDGVDWHSDPMAWQRDRTRYGALQEAGWVVISLVADDVRRRAYQTVRRIQGQLDERRAA